MKIHRLSPQILSDVTNAVVEALKLNNTVNVPVIAEEVRRKNESDNVALEDIELCALQVTHSMCGAVLFDSDRYDGGIAIVAEAGAPIVVQ